jgi:hypothetical protein
MIGLGCGIGRRVRVGRERWQSARDALVWRDVMSKLWAGDLWIGGVLLTGGVLIAAISLGVDDGGSARTAVIGGTILSAGLGMLVRARRQARTVRCVQCTNLVHRAAWTRCAVCDAPLHPDCSEMHGAVYHSDIPRTARHKPPYAPLARGPRKQVVGRGCVECGVKIVTVTDGAVCRTCGAVAHVGCLTPHACSAHRVEASVPYR